MASTKKSASMEWSAGTFDSLVPFPRLQALCRPGGPPPRASTVMRWCKDQGIRCKPDLNGGVWTTVEAINAALGLVLGRTEEMCSADLI